MENMMQVMSNPFNLQKLPLEEAKRIVKENGFRAKVVTSGYISKNTTVEPKGSGSDEFISELIEQGIYVINGGILCK